MNTTAKLHSSLLAINNQDDLVITSQPNFPPSDANTKTMPFDGNYNDFPNTTLPGSFYPDPNTDELSLLEFRLQELQIAYMKRKKYWEGKKEELLAAYPIEDIVDTPVNRTVKDVLNAIYGELRALIAFPDSQLRYIYKRSQPQILILEQTLNQACEKLNKPPQNAGVPESLEKARACLEVCNASITLLSGLGSLMNDVSREIKLCLKCQEILEKTAITLLNFAMTLITRIPLPALDFNFGLKDLYRKSLFHSIHHQTTHIETFVTGVKGDVERASKAVNKFMPLTNPGKLEPIANPQSANPFFNPSQSKALATKAQNVPLEPTLPQQALLA